MASSTRRARTNIGTTNLSTRRSRSTPRPRPSTADPMDLRLRETATWRKTPVPSPAEWASISKKPLWESQTLEFESMQQAREARLQKFVDQERELQLSKVRRRLTEAATKKFGSVAAMFEAFGLAADDTISLDQLTTLLTKHDLYEQVPRSDQRLLLATVNSNHEHAHVRQLLEFLPSSEPAVPALDPKVELIRAEVADRFVESRRRQKLPTDNLYLKRALTDEFRLLDREQAGTVTVEQVQRVLGPERLNLGIPHDQLQTLLQAVPVAEDGKVKYNELVKLLHMEDRTALYSPYFDLRTKVHTMHKVNVQTPWPFMKETEQLLKLGLAREKDALIKQVNPTDELARTRVIPFEQGTPLHLRPHTVHSHVPVRGNQQGQQQSLQRVASSQELFEEIDRAQTAHQRVRPIVRSPQLSLWDDDGSVDVADHYRTMTDEYFAPLEYSPITTFTRKTVSDSERGAIKRERRRRARYRRVEEYYKAAKERQKMDDLAARMNDHQRVMNLSQHMLRNAEIVSASDELRAKRRPYGYPTRRFMPEQHATTLLGSRDGLARYFREIKEDRDFCTVYSKDFCKSALVQS